MLYLPNAPLPCPVGMRNVTVFLEELEHGIQGMEEYLRVLSSAGAEKLIGSRENF